MKTFDYRNENYHLKQENLALTQGTGYEQALLMRTGWLSGKVRRQRATIDRIQAKGWQPSIIIEEHPVG